MIKLVPGTKAQPLSDGAKERLWQMDAVLRAKALSASAHLKLERLRAEALVLQQRLQYCNRGSRTARAF